VVGSCEHGTELLVSIIRGIYWQAEELPASQDRPCSIELPTRYDRTTHLRMLCVSTHVWCAVGVRFCSCEFATTSDPCPTFMAVVAQPGFSAGVAHATAMQRDTCSKNIYSIRFLSPVHSVALRTFWNGRYCASVRNLRLNPTPRTKK
jgi:hypothetical protein